MKALISTLWSTVSGVARSAAQAGLLKRVRLDARVISVGNIQAGGSGKTPLVAFIAKEAHEKGLKVCILSRGYKGKSEKKGSFILPGDQKVRASVVGDEPALLHELCPFAYIGVGSDRVAQYKKIRARSKVKFDLVILDDGFQNYKIHKDLEIVALTSLTPQEAYFRDHIKALKHADLIVWTKGEHKPKSLGKPMVRVRYALPKPKKKKNLWFITGIAHGQIAYTLALKTGYPIVRYLSFADHAEYDSESIQNLMMQAKKVNCVIALTGKDWVKWKECGVNSSEVVILEPEVIFEGGHPTWTRILWQDSL